MSTTNPRAIAKALRRAGILTFVGIDARKFRGDTGRTTAYVDGTFVSSFNGTCGLGHKGVAAQEATDKVVAALLAEGLSPFTPVDFRHNLNGKTFVNYPSGGMYVGTQPWQITLQKEGTNHG